LACQIDADEEQGSKRDLEKLTMACWIRALTTSQAIGEPGEEPWYIGTDWRTCVEVGGAFRLIWLEQAKVGEHTHKIQDIYTPIRQEESRSSPFSFVLELILGTVP
jgi:hypothetical protein